MPGADLDELEAVTGETDFPAKRVRRSLPTVPSGRRARLAVWEAGPGKPHTHPHRVRGCLGLVGHPGLCLGLAGHQLHLDLPDVE